MSDDAGDRLPTGSPTRIFTAPTARDIDVQDRRRRLRVEAIKRLIRKNREESEKRKKLAQEYKPLLDTLVNDLKRLRQQRKGQTPGPTFSDLRDPIRIWRGRVMEWFLRYARKSSSQQYLTEVEHFRAAHFRRFVESLESLSNSEPALLFPPIKTEDLQSQLCIKDMPVISTFFHSKGGNKPSPALRRRDRNEIIREGKNQGLSDLEICIALDHEKLSLPSGSNWDGTSWIFLYNNDPEVKKRIHRLFSKVAVKAGR